MVRRLLRRFKRILIGLSVLMKYTNDESQISEKSIYIDIDDIPFERYFYLFVKFFHLSGYTIYFKPRAYAIGCLIEGGYARYLLDEKVLYFKKHPNKHLLLISNSENGTCLSADYFSRLLKKQFDNSSFYVPMAMHPNIYYENLWNLQFSFRKKQSIFFAGGFNDLTYNAISEGGVFSVLNRVEIYDILKCNYEVHIPTDFELLQNREQEKQVVIVDRDYCEVPIEVLRETLSKYAFFLACPGIVMPFSHNVIEAMSVGSIPLIEKEYAEMFLPYLKDGVNAIIFEGEESLIMAVKRIFDLDSSEVNQMSKNVFEYYHSNLTPTSVVDHIINGNYKKLYIQAEFYSVDLYRDI